MKYRVRQLLCLGLALVITGLLCCPAFAAEEPQKVVRVAFPQQADLTEIREDGSYNGYTYDYLEKIAQLTGWKMEYVLIDEPTLDESLTKALLMVQSGEADLVGGLVKTPELMAQYEYTQNSYGIMYSALATTEENLQLNSSNFMRKSPLVVGLWGSGERTVEKLHDFFGSYQVNYEIKRFDSHQEMLDAFYRGEVDVVPDSTIGSLKGTQQLAIYASGLFYFAATKGETQLVAELDEAIDQLNLAFPYFQSDLAEKYLNNTRDSFFITEEETAYLQNKKVIHALCVDDYAPFVFQDDKGAWKGIAVSLMEEFAEETGLTMEYTKFDRTIDFVSAFESGKYDCILGIPINATYNNKAGVITSTPYLTIQQVYFSKHNAIQKSVSGSRVATLKGSDLADKLVCKEIIYYDTTEQCINAVMSGEVDCGYGNQYCVEYYAQHNYISLNIIPLVSEKRNMEISVNKSENSALLSTLNRYIDHLDSGKMYEYHVAANTEHVNNWVQTLMYSDPISFSIFMALVAFIAFFGIAMFFFAKSSRKKSRQLQIASKAKSDFLSRVSHDMRTPMNAILSFSSMELDKDTSPRQLAADMDQIHRSGQYLLGLINDVLDMSKIENQRMELNLEPVYPSECLRAILATVQPLMEEKKLHFEVQMDIPEAEPVLLLDVMRTKQLFINLLSNAAKFTPEGGTVTFRLTAKELTEQYVVLDFIIRDTGIGMSEEFQKHLFEPFSQEHQESTGQLTGTGLGLAIVKQLVDLMGGTISITSQLNKGTEVSIELRHEVVAKVPRKTAVEAPQDKIDEDALQGKRVLLCEDHPVNAEIVKRLLAKKGMKVEHALNGQQGVECFAESAIGYYDLILMDIKMPVMDGLEAAQRIRALARADAKTVPIIAMTANAFEEDIQASMDAGINVHLSKPIEPRKLFQVLDQLFQRGTKNE
ncbi:MAG: transporter substrate-binding domain-containing protein [Christensenella sp.]|nr:transporter substrate-binding domain-containing protein [Christensenella sp.]